MLSFRKEPVVCPNCRKPAPGGLYISEIFGVEHCGCFWEGDPEKVCFCISEEPSLDPEEREEFGLEENG